MKIKIDNVDEEKLKIQLEVKRKWVENNYNGTVILPTGTGKTYAALLAVEDFDDESKIVIVPSLYLKQQWEERTANMSNFKVIVINTAIKTTHTCDILILDETHRYVSEEFKRIFECVKYKKLLTLTATLERTDQKHYLVENNCPVIYRKTIKEALELNLIPKFIIYNLSVPITELSIKKYSLIDNKFNNFFAFFNFDFSLAMNCLQYENHRVLYSQRVNYSPQEIRIKAINFNRAMAERKNFIYYHPDKTKSVLDIIKKFPDKKIIIFSERKITLEILHLEIPNSGIYDTDKGKKKLKELMDDYKSGKIKILLTAKALDEGMDVPDIDIGIIHSGNSSKINGRQRIGRLLRKDNEKIALIINLYLENTQDQKWLINRGSNIPNTYWINNINDISYEPTKESLKEENRSNYFTKRVQLF